MNPNRTSMNDLRKRAAGIMEFISRTQVEMAGEQTAPEVPVRGVVNGGTPFSGRTGLVRVGSDLAASKLSRQIDRADLEEEAGKKRERAPNGAEEGSFKTMSSLQMMDVLTRELVIWQREHGKWGER